MNDALRLALGLCGFIGGLAGLTGAVMVYRDRRSPHGPRPRTAAPLGRFRERLRKRNYTVSYDRGPRFECVQRRGQTEWFMDGLPISAETAKALMSDLEDARRPANPAGPR